MHYWRLLLRPAVFRHCPLSLNQRLQQPRRWRSRIKTDKVGKILKTGKKLKHDLIDNFEHAVGAGDASAAQSVLQKLQKIEETPSTADYNLVLNAWKHSKDFAAADQAEALLLEMGSLADQASFHAAISAWSNSPKVYAPQRARDLLDHMKEQGVSVDRKSWNAVLKAHANRGDATECETILREMRDAKVWADRDTYGIVLMAWSRSLDSNAPIEAEAVVRTMGSLGIKPRTHDHNNVLSCWANSKRVARAHQLLDALESPNVDSFHIVMEVYASAGDGLRCETLLHDIEKRGLSPTPKSFSIVLQAWQKSDDLRAPQKAQDVLRYMQDRGVAMEASHYKAIIECWSNRPIPDAHTHASEWLRQMLGKYNDGDIEMKPTTDIYNSVLWTFASVGDASKCEQLIEEMENQVGEKANLATYSALLRAWSNAGDQMTGSTKAEQTLQKMFDLSAAGLLDPPNTIACNHVLWTYARCPNASERSGHLLQQMVAEHEAGRTGLKPNRSSYDAVICAYAKAGNVAESEKTFAQMLRAYHNGDDDVSPNSTTIEPLVEAWSKGFKSSKSDAILERMAGLRLDGSQAPAIDMFVKEDTKQSVLRAKKVLLDWVESFQQHGASAFRPHIESFKTVSTALAGHGLALHSEDLLEVLERLYHKFMHEDLQPDRDLFNLTLDAWNRSSNENAPMKARAVLEKMKRLSTAGSERLEVAPDHHSYGYVIACLADSNLEDAPLQADFLLKEMEHRFALSGDISIKPTAAILSALANVHGAAGNFRRCLEMLNRMVLVYEKSETSVKPDFGSFASAMCSIAKSKDPAVPEKAEAILRRILMLPSHFGLEPNVDAYNAVLSSWAGSGLANAPSRAEFLLNELLLSGARGPKPNVSSFNAVIRAYANVGNTERAAELLQKMRAMYRDGNDKLKPDLESFGTVLKAWSKSTEEGAAEHAEDFLREMERLTATGELDVQPDASAYTAVLTCWAKSSSDAAPHRAERLLKEQIQRHASGDRRLAPTANSFNATIDAFASKGLTGDCERLVEAMRSSFQKEAKNAKPNLFTYTALLKAWCRSKSPRAPEKAEALLFDMQVAGRLDARPDAVAYSTVIACWKKSSSIDAPQRARTLLHQMSSRYKKGEKHLAPDSATFTTVMDMYAVLGNAQKCREIMDEMKDSYIEGNISARPGLLAYSTLLKAWSRSVDLDAPVHAVRLLRTMEKDPDVALDTRAYNIVLCSLGKANKQDAETLLAEMIARHRRGDQSTKPDAGSFAAMMAPYADVGDALRCLELWTQMETLQQQGLVSDMPDIALFNTMLKAWSRSGLMEGPAQADKLFHRMKECEDATVKPDETSYRTLMLVHSRSTAGAPRCEELFEELKSNDIRESGVLKPDKIAAMLVLDAWLQSNDSCADEKMQSFRERNKNFLQPEAVAVSGN